MLHKMNAGTVNSDAGFTVEISFRFIVYSESNGHLVEIDIEHTEGPEGIVVYISALAYWKTPAHQEVNFEKKKEIAARVNEPLKFLGKTYSFE